MAVFFFFVRRGLSAEVEAGTGAGVTGATKGQSSSEEGLKSKADADVSEEIVVTDFGSGLGSIPTRRGAGGSI